MEDSRRLDCMEEEHPESTPQPDLDSISSDFVEQMMANGREIFNLIPISRPLQFPDRPFNDQKLLKGHLVNYNRKEKSLEELSKRFLDLFVYQDKASVELDKISLQLGVERRRIYDIINILESLHVIVRTGKNNYLWNGIGSIVKAIGKYQAEARFCGEKQVKRTKSLEVLSTGFLMLFLHWRPRMTLDQAARILVGNIEADKLKTKIRRLYDIANVFKSLGLLRKVTLSTKKPGFQWVGVDGLLKFTHPKHLSTPSLSVISNQSETRIQDPYPVVVSSFFSQYLYESSFKIINHNKSQSLFDLVQLNPMQPLFTPSKSPQPMHSIGEKLAHHLESDSCKSSRTMLPREGFRRLVLPLPLF